MDKYFLFNHFEFENSLYRKLPFLINPYISICYHEIDWRCVARAGATKEENIALACLVYPTFGLPGIGVCCRCIKINSIVPEKDRFFWSAITALFIVKPLFLRITAAFDFGDREMGFIQNPGLINLIKN